ncbi:MAG: HD domain-containing protein [Saprospiraceae bacterium]|nr:HD domain-containing protein [Saprospiraceae bacterium]
MKGYIKLRKRAFELLENQLSSKLSYHGIHHTMDVLKTVNFYIRLNKLPRKEAQLLRIAALYHDIGFIETYKEHEKIGVGILKRHMLEFGCDMKDFKILEGLIMSTKVPQNPKTKLERILCDADLFYLGGRKYYPISETLFEELKNFKIITSEEQWNKIQVSFLSSHDYHTRYAKKNLREGKNRRIEEISKLTV